MRDFLKMIREWLAERRTKRAARDRTPRPSFIAWNIIEHLLQAVQSERRQLTSKTVADLMRTNYPWQEPRALWEFTYANLRVSDISVFAAFPPDDAVELVGGATLNQSGYVRQAALVQLARVPHPRAVAYVLPRLGDWVPQVRDEAERTLQQIMRVGAAEWFTEYYPIVQRLLRVGRVDLRDAQARIFSYLREERFRPVLFRILEGGPPAQRKFVFSVLKPELLDNRSVLLKGLGDKSPEIRAWVASHVMAGHQACHADGIRQLLHDKSPRVRSTVLQWIAPELAASMLPDIQEQVFANSRPVRDAARFVLQRHGVDEFAASYRDRLVNATETTVEPGWIAGLGETGQPADVPLISRFRKANRGRVRMAAIAAMASLDLPNAVDQVISSLADSSSSVRRTATAILSRNMDDRVVSAARDILATGPEHARLASLAVLVNRPSWDPVPDILAALSANIESVQEQAWVCLSRWYSKELQVRLDSTGQIHARGASSHSVGPTYQQH